PEAIIVRELPSLLGAINVKPLVHAILHELEESETPQHLHAHLHEILASHGCHNSIRAGRRLSLDEMNAILRDMEKTPHAGQCNHGRPTYVALERRDIEKLFGRR
ncbi:MAG: DNA mismatch repair protein MutL, partial [Alphaproteobacteria bacterium]